VNIRKIRIVEWETITSDGAVLAIVITAVGALGDFGVQILLARSVSVAWYGDYSIAYSVLILGGIVAILGSDRTCMRFLPGYIVKGDQARISGFCTLHVGLAIGVSLLIVGVTAIAHYALDTEGISFFDTSKGHPVLFAVWLIPFYAVYRLAPGVLSAAGRAIHSTVSTRLGVPGVTAAVIVLIPLAGYAITPEAMLGGFALAYFLVVLAVIAFLPKDVSLWSWRKAYDPRLWLGISIPIMVGQLVWKLNGYSGTLMLEIIGKDEAQVGLFSAATNAGALVMIPMTALVATILPRLGPIAQDDENHAARQKLYGQATRQLTFFTLLVALPVLLFREQVLGLFGADYQSAGLVLMMIATTFLVTGSLGISAPFLQFCGYEKLILCIIVGSTLLDVLLCSVLVPSFKANGAALSFLIRGILADGIALYVLWRYLGLVPFLTESRSGSVPASKSGDTDVRT
jgi:O-antigen/teichoic acid export membrane protein